MTCALKGGRGLTFFNPSASCDQSDFLYPCGFQLAVLAETLSYTIEVQQY